MIQVFETFATAEEANIFMEEYMNRYHPAGYGTTLRIEEVSDGFAVRGYRYISCD